MIVDANLCNDDREPKSWHVISPSLSENVPVKLSYYGSRSEERNAYHRYDWLQPVWNAQFTGTLPLQVFITSKNELSAEEEME